ncbi:MAG: hypothetical protein HXS44_01695 [Theionarchaea archaeon]|nr:hypothetical protein [Theionarchaea archaeon]
MIIQGRMRCEGLVIGSPEVERFIEKIRSEKLTGYFLIEFESFTFLLFMEEGGLTHGFRVIEDQLFAFSHLPDILYSLEGGRMAFFEASAGALQGLLDMKFGNQVYGTLYTSFTDLEKLFLTLEQKRLTGSVEIDLPFLNAVVVMEKGTPIDVVVPQEEGKDGKEILSYILEKASEENGMVRIFERRNPLTILYPDPEEVFAWSHPRRLKLEFAFGQLGKEFEVLLDQKLTITQILNRLHVDFTEIADMYTYLSAKGYITTKRRFA